MMWTYMNGPPSWKKLLSVSKALPPDTAGATAITESTILPKIGLINFCVLSPAGFEALAVASGEAFEESQQSGKETKIMPVSPEVLSRQALGDRRENFAQIMRPKPYLPPAPRFADRCIPHWGKRCRNRPFSNTSGANRESHRWDMARGAGDPRRRIYTRDIDGNRRKCARVCFASASDTPSCIPDKPRRWTLVWSSYTPDNPSTPGSDRTGRASPPSGDCTCRTSHPSSVLQRRRSCHRLL